MRNPDQESDQEVFLSADLSAILERVENIESLTLRAVELQEEAAAAGKDLDRSRVLADHLLRASALIGVAGILFPLGSRYRFCVEAGDLWGAGAAVQLSSFLLGGLAIICLARGENAALPPRAGLVGKMRGAVLGLISAMLVGSVAVVLSNTVLASDIGKTCVRHIEASN